jgi:transcriptional regulator with XRE-family HTH domain
MNTRLKQFIAAENITQAQLADRINVVRASVSHILAGRNKPSYEFISGLMRHYPNLNMEWLMFGKGKMYKNASAEAPDEAAAQVSGDLFADEFPIMQEVYAEAPEENVPAGAPAPAPAPAPASGASINEIKALINTMQKPVSQRKLIKITAFYDDGTFQELTAN